MRSEQEMYDLILATAQDDERIRAVILSGSRANRFAPRDIFQDYDILYLVTDVASIKHEPGWIKRFGELMILQLPDDMRMPPAGDDESYCYLMQFTDGNRLDLTLYPILRLAEFEQDNPSVLLLDKDGLMKGFPPSNDLSQATPAPSRKEYEDCCNEFWWVCPYVAKGLWREEIIYAKYMLDRVIRPQLDKMLTWYVGVQTGFSRYPGKYGKYLKQYLEPDLWHTLERTYAGAGYAETWQALYAMCDLFRAIAASVAHHLEYDYPQDDDHRVSAHLRHVQQLPRDAQVIY
jgi:aminoglycoside 6-adenylyltransferase